MLLEPDGLGIIPYNTDINGNAEWCRPDLSGTGLTPAAANQARYDQIGGAVARLEQQPNVSVYLDGTHSAWLGVGDIAQRLVKAHIANAQGFFLNVSNYQFTPNLTQYGTWVSQCLAVQHTSATRLPEPVLERRPAPHPDSEPARRVERRCAEPLRRVERHRQRSGAEHLRRAPPLLDDSRDDALRHRHEPQRAGPVEADGVVPGRAGLVQPARPRARPAADDGHGQPAGRRVPLDQGAGRVRRVVQPRHPGTTSIPNGAARSIRPPATGSRSRPCSSRSSRARDSSRRRRTGVAAPSAPPPPP